MSGTGEQTDGRAAHWTQLSAGALGTRTVQDSSLNCLYSVMHDDDDYDDYVNNIEAVK